MTVNSMVPSVTQLFEEAVVEGEITGATAQALQPVARAINGTQGVSADEVQTSEVTLVGLLIDDSGSMGRNTELVIQGHNEIIGALRESGQEESILVQCRYLNGIVLYPFSFLSGVPLMSQHNYRADGGTPLFHESLVMVGSQLAKTQEFFDQNVPARSVTVIVTDGNDENSASGFLEKAAAAIKPMTASDKHIVAGVGISDGSTDFRAVFQAMGIPERWILTPGGSSAEIRRVFRMISQSVVRASQSGQAFGQLNAGGWGNNATR